MLAQFSMTVMETAARPGSPRAWRDANRQRVLAVLRSRGPLSQAEVARASGLAPATVSGIVTTLVAEGILQRDTPSSRGVPLRFARRAGLVAGMDLDHRRLRVVLADHSHAVLGERVHVLDVDHEASEAIARARDSVDWLLARQGASRAEVTAVGVGLAAPVDPVTGQVASSAILPGWVGLPAADIFGAAFGLPVLLDNNANLGALGEASWGAARGLADSVYIQVGTGIGAGLVLRGSLYRGLCGTAGEIGHMVVDERGYLCRCGSRGCLETVAGLGALLESARTQHGPDLSADDLLALAGRGDIGVRRLVADAGESVGKAVAIVCNLVCPEVVVVGGQLATAGAVFLEPLRRAVERGVMEPVARTVRIMPSGLGDRAEALGAVAMALRGGLSSVGCAAGGETAARSSDADAAGGGFAGRGAIGGRRGAGRVGDPRGSEAVAAVNAVTVGREQD